MRRSIIIAQLFIIISAITELLQYWFWGPLINIIPFLPLFLIGFIPTYLVYKIKPALTNYVFALNAVYLVSLAYYFVKFPIIQTAFFFLPVIALLMYDTKIYYLSSISGLAAFLLLTTDRGKEQWMFISIYLIYCVLLWMVQGAVQKNIAAKEAIQQGVKAFSLSIEAKDVYTQGHSIRVAQYAVILAKHLKSASINIEELELTGIVHDIGKISTPDSVLMKEGKLTQEEYEIMKKHPVDGMLLAQSFGYSEKVLKGILHHHERFDGRGYPEGLEGKTIPLYSRILAVADSFDAMTSHRSYRKALTAWEAKIEIERNSGTMYDPEIVDVFKTAYYDMLLIYENSGNQPVSTPYSATGMTS